MATVFELAGFEFTEDDDSLPLLDNDVSLDTKSYGFKVRRTYMGLYSNVAKAESAIKDEIKRWQVNVDKGYSSPLGYACFELIEKAIDDTYDDYGGFREFESVRTYFSDGTLNCFSDLDSSCHKKFMGRKDPVKVKAGEYAYYLTTDCIVPVFMEAVSMTEAEWKTRFKPDVYGDCFDDSGIAYSANDTGHFHLFSPYVFPASKFEFIRIPDEAKAAIQHNVDHDLTVV